jgi:hypothetical protein
MSVAAQLDSGRPVLYRSFAGEASRFRARLPASRLTCHNKGHEPTFAKPASTYTSK